MAKKSLGYVQLEWTCPSCGIRNPGATRTCKGCGAAMPDDVSFELPRQQELDTSEKTAARVAAGPDIICPYCGTRNRGDAEKCTQCSGDLVGADRRSLGGVVGAFDTSPAPDITCPHCGATNPATAHQCSQCGGPLGEKEPEKLKPKPKPQPTKRRRLPIVAILAVALVICGLLFAITQFSRSEVVGVVDRLAWRTTIQIQALGPVAREDWHDRVPASALRQGCTPKVRHTVSDPVPGAIEVCGTPYVVDTGTGQGQVMQDCVYQVREDWCRYTVNEWRAAGERVATGENSQPHWPQVSLTANQREAGRAATYIVVFIADDQERRLTVSNAEQWLQYEVGSEWILEINALGGITSLRPAD